MKAIEVEGVIGRLSSRVDKSLSFSVSTPELSVDERSVFFDYQGTVARFLIKPLSDPVTEVMEVAKELEHKTPSQRLRGVLFVLFKQFDQSNQLAPGTLFEDFYAQQMNIIIESTKLRLDQQ